MTRKLMIYCPEIYLESFVLLTIIDESYYIRAFTGSKKGMKWKADVVTISQFLRRFPIVHQYDVSEERVSVENETYWEDRTIELNQKNLIGA